MRIFVIAGEPSGDLLGGAVMGALRARVPGTAFDGVGGPAMQAEGLASRFPMAELSLMGLIEVLPKYFALKRRIRELAALIAADPPDLLLTIDSPDFCLRVARAARAQVPGLRTTHYVAPSVWAWRPERAPKMAAVIDHVLALLPFEPPYMEAAGMVCDFVGHPVVTRPRATAGEIASFRARAGLGEAPVLLALPGSRRGEVARLAPRFGPALAEVLAGRPGWRVVVPVAAPVAAEVRALTTGWPGDPVLVVPGEGPDPVADKRAAFATAEVALAASGTVSLELAQAGTPMVIAYDMAPLTRWIMERKLRIDTVTLVNLVSETRAVPECLGRDCRPERIAPALEAVLDAPGAQRQAMALTMARLGRDDVSDRLSVERAQILRDHLLDLKARNWLPARGSGATCRSR